MSEQKSMDWYMPADATKHCPGCDKQCPLGEFDGTKCWRCQMPKPILPTCGECKREVAEIMDNMCRTCWEKPENIRARQAKARLKRMKRKEGTAHGRC